MKFAGAQTITIPASGAVRLQPAKGFTLSAWVRFDAAQPACQAYIAQLADQGRELVLGIAGTQAFARYAAGGSPVERDANHVSSPPANGTISRCALGDGHLTLFVDGADAGHANAELQEIGGALTVGGSAANGNYFTGELDELEVSNTARSADWLKAAARSQGMVAPLVVYGGDTQKEGGNESYFATTLRNVTVDGWVVIGILGLHVLSLAIMIMGAKMLYLKRVARGNISFLASSAAADDPAALAANLGSGSTSAIVAQDGGEEFGVSTLAQLYHHGMRRPSSAWKASPSGAERAQIAVGAIHRSNPREPGCLASRVCLQQLNKPDGLADHRRSPAARSWDCSARSSAS